MSGFIDFLQKILGDIFSAVLQPILTIWLQKIVGLIWKFLMQALGYLLYLIYSTILAVVDYLAKIFAFFSGTEEVLYKSEQMTLLEVFFQLDDVKKAFLIVTALAMGLTFLFTIYKVGKSISDMALEDKNPIGKVLGNGLKAAITFAIIPFLCLVMVQLCTITLNGIDTAMSQSSMYSENTDLSIGTILFLISSMNAADPDDYNQYNLSAGSNAAFNDYIRAPFYKGDKSYTDMTEVDKYFEYSKFDYIMGFISAIFIMLMLILSIFQFIRRLFEVIVLYIVSPLFVSTLPLDDGAMFSKWKDLFIAKFFSAFGSIFAIRLFLLIVPYIAFGNLTLYAENQTIDYFLKLLIIMGGTFAIYKSQNLILQILNPEAAMMDQQGAAFIMGAITGAATGGLGSVAGGMSTGANKISGAASRSLGNDKKESSNQFTGKS